MLLAAARALAAVVSDEELNAAYIVPSVFHPEVTKAVASAVQHAAMQARERAEGGGAADGLEPLPPIGSGDPGLSAG